MDLFSGAGGLTFGFQNKIYRNRFKKDNKFNVVFANEFDRDAATTFKENFPSIPMIEDDIAKIDEDYLKKMYFNLKDLDLIIGGPPCQSYSTVGKRQYDNRAKMYKEYRRILSILKPKMFVFENVIGLLTMKNDKGLPVIDDVKMSFQDFSDFNISLSYKIKTKVLNAKNFGVPQSRERVFIVGVRSDLKISNDWTFPEISTTKYLTVRDAISDLPPLQNGTSSKTYNSKPLTKYQFLVRNEQTVLENHSSGKHGERMLRIMKAVPEGESKPFINKLVDEGKLPKDLYLTSGYDNTYGRLWWDKVSPTITNNLSSPSSLRCIHPKQNRPLSSREGARLQSFPDSFKFFGSKEKVNSQIGNAVPPILSMALACRIKEFFKNNQLETVKKVRK